MKTSEQNPKYRLDIKKYFVTGLLALLPLWITFVILKTIFNWISNTTKPILGPTIELLLRKEPASFLLTFTSFICTLILVYLSGILVTNLVSKKILIKIEDILIKIPILKDIYSASKELLRFVFGEKTEYRRVVLIEWPAKGYNCFGFVTSEIKTTDGSDTQNMVSVFIPSTPNPTTGWLTILPENKTIPLEIRPEDALKIVISGGVVGSDKLKNLSFFKENHNPQGK